jgi:hypothetical protein
MYKSEIHTKVRTFVQKGEIYDKVIDREMMLLLMVSFRSLRKSVDPVIDGESLFFIFIMLAKRNKAFFKF